MAVALGARFAAPLTTTAAAVSVDEANATPSAERNQAILAAGSRDGRRPHRPRAGHQVPYLGLTGPVHSIHGDSCSKAAGSERSPGVPASPRNSRLSCWPAWQVSPRARCLVLRGDLTRGGGVALTDHARTVARAPTPGLWRFVRPPAAAISIYLAVQRQDVPRPIGLSGYSIAGEAAARSSLADTPAMPRRKMKRCSSSPAPPHGVGEVKGGGPRRKGCRPLQCAGRIADRSIESRIGNHGLKVFCDRPGLSI